MEQSVWSRVLNLIYPHKCFCCSAVLAGNAYLCADCAPLLPLTGGSLCLQCGKHQGDCICEKSELGYDHAASPFFYRDGIDHGIHRYKYDSRQYYANFLAPYMADTVKTAFAGVHFACITYVPMHRKKERQRGFCQTKLLAQKLSDLLCIPVREDILLHTGKGSAQMTQKGRNARMENASISYASRKSAQLDGDVVLLVDDVLTSGSTVHRCGSLLRKKGASQVYVITAATTRS